jgi:hypothetical protein
MPFVKGQSGNPGGRSKVPKLITDTLLKVATQNPDKLRLACEKLLDKMVEGDISAFREFTDRLEGKAIQGIEGPGENGEITVTIKSQDANVL